MSNPTSDKIFEVWLQVVLGMYVALGYTFSLCWIGLERIQTAL